MKKTLLACSILPALLVGCGDDNSTNSPTPSLSIQAYDGAIWAIDGQVDCENGTHTPIKSTGSDGITTLSQPNAVETCTFTFGPSLGAIDVTNGKAMAEAIYVIPKGLITSTTLSATASPFTTLLAKNLGDKAYSEETKHVAMDTFIDLGLEELVEEFELETVLYDLASVVKELESRDIDTLSTTSLYNRVVATTQVLSDTLAVNPHAQADTITSATVNLTETVLEQTPTYPYDNGQLVVVDVKEVAETNLEELADDDFDPSNPELVIPAPKEAEELDPSEPKPTPIPELGEQDKCEQEGGHWYENACHERSAPLIDLPIVQPITDFDNYQECMEHGGHWYNNQCNADEAPLFGLPTIKPIIEFDNQEECIANGGFWYYETCNAQAGRELKGQVVLGSTYSSEGLTVFLDSNLDKLAGPEEAKTEVNQDGSFVLTMNDEHFASTPFTPVRLEAQGVIYSGLVTADNELFVTPYTTSVINKLHRYIGQGSALSTGTLDIHRTIAENSVLSGVKAQVPKGTIIDPSKLFADFSQSPEFNEHVIVQNEMLEEITQLEAKMGEELASNQKAIVDITYSSSVEHYTGNIIDLKEEIRTIETKLDTGETTLENSATKWLHNEEKCQPSNPYCSEYEQANWKETLSNADMQGEMLYTAEGHWKIDANQDGEFQFVGQSVSMGTLNQDGLSTTISSYYDETDADTEFGVSNGREYQGTPLLVDGSINIDIVDFEGNFDTLMYLDNTSEPEFGVNAIIVSDKYTENSAPQSSNNLTYQQQGYLAYLTDYTVINEMHKDWDADGSINEYIRNSQDVSGNTKSISNEPRWKGFNPQIGADEFANYRWDKGELSSYWLDLSNTYDVAIDTFCETGERYVMDLTTTTKLDNTNFNGWTMCSKPYQELDERVLTSQYITYHNDSVEGYESITPAGLEIGQVVNIEEFDKQTQRTVIHKFIQWGAKQEEELIVDLEQKIIGLLDNNGHDPRSIGLEDIAGLSEINTLISDSFVYDGNGEPISWNYQVEGGASGQTTLDDLDIGIEHFNQWTIVPVSGGMIINNHKTDQPYAYETTWAASTTVDKFSFTTGYVDQFDEWHEVNITFTAVYDAD